jgi:predicted branched-subunit amino acid permease
MTSAAMVPSVWATRGSEFAAGARAMLPWLAGVVPFGLVIGVSAARADIPVLAGWATGPLIYAGSAQVATIEMLHAGAAPPAGGERPPPTC